MSVNELEANVGNVKRVKTHLINLQHKGFTHQ